MGVNVTDAQRWQRLGVSHVRAGRMQDALTCTRRALALATGDPGLQLQCARNLAALGERREALGIAEQLTGMPRDRADWNDALGTLFTFCEEPARALPFFERAATLAPKNAEYLYNLATAHRMTGNFAAAEALLDRVVSHRPEDASAYYMRSDLRTQTAADNHIEEMIVALDSLIQNVDDRVRVCFAIAKELDDIGEFKRAFRYIKLGCDQQRRLFTYNVADDVETLDRIIALYDRAAIENAVGIDATECLFVIGLPRTGTTLLERILASHSAVYGAGESPAFPAATIKAIERLARHPVGKREAVELSLSVDAPELGRSYLEAARPRTGDALFLVDKQPLNYLYAGLIRRALPKARFIAIARDPTDTCFAMYRTLFTGAYPFSYDLSELASYYAAWHRLICHWRSVLGDSLLIVQYEDLVRDLEATVRQLLAHCGLQWDAACLESHRQARAVTSASAVQVRQPLYSSSIGKWRNYAEFLEPLIQSLAAVEPDGGWRFE